MAHKFEPRHWERLVSSERRAFLDPDRFLDVIGIPTGHVVADLGAGPGFFTLPLAERVGPGGKVFALDVAPEMVALLRERQLPAQVEVLLSGETRLPLPDHAADLALLAFVLHELENPAKFLAEVRRIVRAHGRLVVLEWVPQEEEMGPPLHERLSPKASAKLLGDAGFRAVESGMANGSNYYQVVSPTAE